MLGTIKDDMHPTAIINSPIGLLKIMTTADSVTGISFAASGSTQAASCPLAKTVATQLHAYFEDPDFQFDLPVSLDVSEHQQRVLEALQRIPRGKTRSYGELAQQLHSSARAIGNACRHNPIPIIIPCHRITAKNGIGGFSGDTSGHMINIKRWLLQHECYAL